MSQATTPKLAAGVILVRGGAAKGFEIFFSRRPDGMSVLAGMYGYPGGTLLREDCSAMTIERCAGLDGDRARRIVGAQFRPGEAVGLWIAGVRELFEEIGVLLAVEETGAVLELDSKRAVRLRRMRQALLRGATDFPNALESEHLRCDLSRLAYFSHWQTPGQVPARFDTYFFLAVMPDNQTPLPTSDEVAPSLWLTPDRALRLFGRGELPMIFPTFAALRTLADFDSLDSVWKEYFRGRPSRL